MRILLVALVSAGLCSAQAPLQFEAASVRPAATGGRGGGVRGGPGTADPGRMTFERTPLRMLLMTAFSVPFDQLSGPDYVVGQGPQFDVVATIPAGTTKEQANEMLVNLLKDRFHLAYHREKRDFDMYALVVAKGGPKLKDAEVPNGAPPEAPAPGTRAVAMPQDRDGFPILPAGREAAQGAARKGVMRYSFRMASTGTLLGMLQFMLMPSRTLDRTGLTGKYDFTLEFSQSSVNGPGGQPFPLPADADLAPDLFTALEKQLGLKLEKSKVQLDVIVVDHMDKQPTEN